MKKPKTVRERAYERAQADSELTKAAEAMLEEHARNGIISSDTADEVARLSRRARNAANALTKAVKKEQT